MKIKATVFADAHDNVNFKNDDGEQVNLDRTRVYIQPEGARYPESILVNGNLPLGEYTGFVDLLSKKDKLTASLDVDSLTLVKPQAHAKVA